MIATGVNASLRTVQRAFANHDNMEYGHIQKRPKLEPGHVKLRFEWAKKFSWREPKQWLRSIFADDKRFCLDGPDGLAYYWHDKRLSKKKFSKRANGGGGVMVWAGISWRGKTPLVFFDYKINVVQYVDMLEKNNEPFIEEYYPKGVTFLQDGAPVHTAKYTKEYFMESGIVDMKWAPRSPDINSIKNCRGAISMSVYDGNRQFDTIDDLKECLLYEWENLSLSYIRELIMSMPRRVWELYQKRGHVTSY